MFVKVTHPDGLMYLTTWYFPASVVEVDDDVAKRLTGLKHAEAHPGPAEMVYPVEPEPVVKRTKSEK